ncbi:MAG: TRAP transporter small permease, partial [Alphaproteobacteria bacterium]
MTTESTSRQILSDPNPAWARKLSAGLDSLAAYLLLVLVILTVIDVTGRELFNHPLPGATELTVAIMALAVFSVLPSVCAREQNITVDLIDMWSPNWTINPRQFVMCMIGALFCGLASWRVWIVAERHRTTGEITEYLGIPIFYVTYFLFFMCVASSIALAFTAYRYARGCGPMSPRRRAHGQA